MQLEELKNTGAIMLGTEFKCLLSPLARIDWQEGVIVGWFMKW